ncbi:MAG: hypothetical protein ACOH2B_14570 [Burkholderiaceae bacterium]
MKLPRPSRFIAACIALLSMLFMQLAVAGYACPELKIDIVSQSVTMSTDAGGGMSGCADMDAEQSSLCDALDQSVSQSLDRPELPRVQPFIAVALPLAFDASPPTYSLIAVRPDSLLLTRITAPPLSIRNCCFRI